MLDYQHTKFCDSIFFHLQTVGRVVMGRLHGVKRLKMAPNDGTLMKSAVAKKFTFEPLIISWLISFYINILSGNIKH